MGDEQPELTGILLAGAAGSGKRTSAFALSTLSRRFVRFPALTTARPAHTTPARESTTRAR